ncbi:DUF72 domain-containing protein [Algisphaera agarilytica]|uniref:Uncharacterized protein YecE (DUF72 family) n=1 Tax=Algisphaera agarilytica TaxID=1385975 RepID=A0A7X0H9N6_9BACT|nr:DUF72 domain-containing protein [Algisphaera agarilytica]MBB6430716.1 uncharacterized protein YecE (DUF72 family) [Algisphaera agarilytica]
MIHLGTIGFAYPGWTGSFYPPGTKPEDRLARYARQFNTIEIDTTFHAMPPRDRVERWAQVTPDGFTFSVKTPRNITHEGLVGADLTLSLMCEFLDTMRELGDKLGIVLLQFPPSFVSVRRQDLIKLLDVLDQAGQGIRFAIELRHDSWWSDDTVRLFRERNIAWAAVDQPTVAVSGVSPDDAAYQGDKRAPRPLIVTSDFLFIRWVGHHDQIPTDNAEVVDPTPRLDWWMRQLRPFLRDESPVRNIYGYFGNNYAGHAPASCRRLMSLLDLPAPPPLELTDSSQGSLF